MKKIKKKNRRIKKHVYNREWCQYIDYIRDKYIKEIDCISKAIRLSFEERLKEIKEE